MIITLFSVANLQCRKFNARVYVAWNKNFYSGIIQTQFNNKSEKNKKTRKSKKNSRFSWKIHKGQAN